MSFTFFSSFEEQIKGEFEDFWGVCNSAWCSIFLYMHAQIINLHCLLLHSVTLLLFALLLSCLIYFSVKY